MIVYTDQSIAGFGLWLGFSYDLLYQRWGFEFGEKFHMDPAYRVARLMEIDRAVFEDFSDLGMGYKNPLPRPWVAPFGDRFVPALFGCEVDYFPNITPWARERIYSEEEILSLEDWTVERFINTGPVREITSQAEFLRKRYGAFHSLQDLGSVINTAIYLRGIDLFADCLESPDLIRRLYDNITQAMLISFNYFPKSDGLSLGWAGIGNCSVCMLSPDVYSACNYEFDKRIEAYCIENQMGFGIHQDSAVTPHIKNYALGFPYATDFDFGMDTDFEALAQLRRDVNVTVEWFPQYLQSHSISEIVDEVHRLREVGRQFKSFGFKLLDIDADVPEESLRAFYHATKETALQYC